MGGSRIGEEFADAGGGFPAIGDQRGALFFPCHQIRGEQGFLPAKVLQAFQVGFEDRIGIFGYPANRPVVATLGLDRTSFLERPEVPGNLWLFHLQNGGQVADAERSLQQQIENPQASGVTKTVVNLKCFHLPIYSNKRIFGSTTIFFFQPQFCSGASEGIA